MNTVTGPDDLIVLIARLQISKQFEGRNSYLKRSVDAFYRVEFILYSLVTGSITDESNIKATDGDLGETS